MAFNVNPFNIYRYLLLGIALVLTIPELALLAEFSRHSIESQGSIYTFEIVGLAASVLTLLVLPVLIFWPRISPGSPISFLIFEIPMFSVLSGLWLTFVVLEFNQQTKLYPIPNAYRYQKNVNGCQFAPKGLEAHLCNRLTANSTLVILICVLLFKYTLVLFLTALICQLRGTPFWMRTLKDAPWNVPGRQLQEPRAPAARSRHAVYKLQLFGQGEVLKHGGKGGVVDESEGAQDRRENGSPSRIGSPSPPYL